MWVRTVLHNLKERIKENRDRRFYLSESRTRELTDSYLRNHTVAKLQIGCGINLLPDWLNTDVSLLSCKKGAAYMDASKAFPLPDASIDYIFSEHQFEHLSFPEAVNMLKECHRVLKPDGVIRIVTPDLRFFSDLYLHPEKPVNKRFIEWSAGGGAGGGVFPEYPAYIISKYHTAWGHRIIYDAESLSALLRENGFDDVCQCEIGKSNHDALTDVEGHHVKYPTPYEFCVIQTLILEAKKSV